MGPSLALRRPPPAGIRLRRPGRVDYLSAWQAMREFTDVRGPETADEIWLLEHPPVYTLGVAGRPEHLLADNGIPVVRCDRGGQITYHGPGQVVAYLLLDLRRLGISVKGVVSAMEQAVIDLLAESGVIAGRCAGAPGVYAAGAKVAALGLKVRKGCCYHGLAFNADMDLAPFAAIDPCGYPGLAVTSARELGLTDSVETLRERLAQHLLRVLRGGAAASGDGP